MTNTTNLNLGLIEEHDLIDFSIFNENANIIDTAYSEMATETEKIPTMQAAIEDNNEDIEALQGTTTQMSSTIANHTQQISDINTINTNQNNRLSAIENSKMLFDLNGTATTYVKEVTIVRERVDVTAHSSFGYVANVTIPISSLPQANNYKVVSAVAYNDGISAVPSQGFNIINAVINNNKLIVNFQTISNNSALDGLTVALKVICY